MVSHLFWLNKSDTFLYDTFFCKTQVAPNGADGQGGFLLQPAPLRGTSSTKKPCKAVFFAPSAQSLIAAEPYPVHRLLADAIELKISTSKKIGIVRAKTQLEFFPKLFLLI